MAIRVNFCQISLIGFACIAFFQCGSKMESTKNQASIENDTVFAEVIFYSADGHKSPLNQTITSENIALYLPDIEVVNEVVHFFKEKKMNLEYVHGVSANLMGSINDFEQLFGVKLIRLERGFKIDAEDYLQFPLEKIEQNIQNKIVAITLPPVVEYF